MKAYKKLFYVFLIILLALTLTGCRQSDDDNDLDYSEGQQVENQNEEGEGLLDDEEQNNEHNEEEHDPVIGDDEGIFDSIYVTVTGSSVNLRSGPGTKFDVVGSAKAGDKLEVEFFMEHWIKVKMPDGSGAYLAGWFTDKNLPEPDGENLREEKLEEVF